MTTHSGYKFPILDSSGNPTSTVVDMADMFVSKDIFLMSGLWQIMPSSPIQIGALTNWKQIACGDTTGIHAIKTDGTLWGWLGTTAGDLGNGTKVYYSSPIQIGSLTNWKQISRADNAVSAVKTDGTLWTWGYNAYGQLGNGNIVSYSSPIQVGTLTNWKQVASGTAVTSAIKTDGTLWTWGWGAYSQLGNGTLNIDYSSPIQVGLLTDWKYVSVGLDTIHAIKTDGTLWAWGYQGTGGLGVMVSAALGYSSPVQVGSLTNWKQVADTKIEGILAVKTDGTLWAWGRNYKGLLGLSNLVSYSSPVQVGSLTNWKQVAPGYGAFMAVKTDGTLWTCGYNVPNYSNISYSSPIQVGALTWWKQVASYNGGSFVIGSSDLPT